MAHHVIVMQKLFKLSNLTKMQEASENVSNNQTCYSNYYSAEGGLVFFVTVCKLVELEQISWSALAIAKGLIDDRRGSGPSAAILLHRASQLLITSVNLPLSSPISTCNELTAYACSKHYDSISIIPHP